MTSWILSKVLTFFGLLELSFAQGTTPKGGGTTPPAGGGSITLINPLACDNLLCIGKAILTALYTISIPIVTVMVIVGAFQILTAAGDPEKFQTGRRTITYAVIGFVLIILAFGVTELIKDILQVK